MIHSLIHSVTPQKISKKFEVKYFFNIFLVSCPFEVRGQREVVADSQEKDTHLGQGSGTSSRGQCSSWWQNWSFSAGFKCGFIGGMGGRQLY